MGNALSPSHRGRRVFFACIAIKTTSEAMARFMGTVDCARVRLIYPTSVRGRPNLLLLLSTWYNSDSPTSFHRFALRIPKETDSHSNGGHERDMLRG
jgi:hypothetical protein